MRQFTIYNVQCTILAVIAALCFTACQPDEPERPVQSSYPRKHLIEEFTGQDCGYCPYGMDCIHEFMENDTNFILVLHHYGYKKDHFSVSGSQTITNALNVNGAPSASIDRAKTNTGSSKAVIFHPADLLNTKKSQFETETYASIHIDNSYDANSRTLTAKVSGEISDPWAEDLYLTVLVKESGMIDYQQDYYSTFEGWKEFRHTNAVRAFLTQPKGDELIFSRQRYNETYTLTLNEEWVPENCMVVAFITENFKPVIQAEQAPVIRGTQGGADIQHGGITPVPVADYYPEPNATKGPSDYSGEPTDTMTYSQAYYENDGGVGLWTLMTYNANRTVKVGTTTCVPFAYIYFITETSATSIPAGTYELNLSGQPGSAYAGYRNDEQQSLGGSMLYYTGKEYFDQGYLDPRAQWLIADGTITVTETGWELIGHARNGADIHLVGNTAIKASRSNSPAKLPRL